jgi:hypothetical protein
MFSRLAVLLVVAASLMAQTGQGPTSIRHHYKPGDTLHYTVTFEGNPNFDSVAIYFQGGPVPPDQSGLTVNFGIDRSTKTASGTFDVDGSIPDSVATGTYQLVIVQTRIKPQGVKDYEAKSFHESIEIENSVRYEFPPLKSIVPK